MRKLILLTALASVIGVTWAATAAPSATGTEPQHEHSMHGMGAGHGRMQGMMGGHGTGQSMEHDKGIKRCHGQAQGTAPHNHHDPKPAK